MSSLSYNAMLSSGFLASTKSYPFCVLFGDVTAVITVSSFQDESKLIIPIMVEQNLT